MLDPENLLRSATGIFSWGSFSKKILACRICCQVTTDRVIFMKPSINVSIFTVNLILKGVKIRIVQSPRTDAFPSLDTVYLSQKGLADVRSLNITRLVGSGILHTKMWLVDGKHFYVGSANQDWRALTQVWCNLCKIFNTWLTCDQVHLFIRGMIAGCYVA